MVIHKGVSGYPQPVDKYCFCNKNFTYLSADANEARAAPARACEGYIILYTIPRILRIFARGVQKLDNRLS